MPLQGSGSISISEIVTEFGGTAPHSLSEYYKDGDNVPSTKAISASATKSTDGDTDDFGGVTGLTVTRATDSVTAPSGSGTGSGSADGITVTVSTSGSFTQTVASGQARGDGFSYTFSANAGDSYSITSTSGGSLYSLNPQTLVKSFGGQANGTLPTTGSYRLNSSGDVSETANITVTRSVTAYQIQFNNTNAYAVSLTSSSTGGARTLSASSGNVTVQAGSTTDNQAWTIASTAPTVYDFSVTNGTGVDGTANSTSVANGATVTISDNQGSSSLAVSWSATETINADVPTSGAISMTDFYSAEDA